VARPRTARPKKRRTMICLRPELYELAVILTVVLDVTLSELVEASLARELAARGVGDLRSLHVPTAELGAQLRAKALELRDDRRTA